MSARFIDNATLAKLLGTEEASTGRVLREIGPKRAAPRILLDLEVEPFMLGGMARTREHGQYDLRNPVRAPSILGQLRFFWRLITAASNPEQLRARENGLFGGSAGAPASGTEDLRSASFSAVVRCRSGAQRIPPPGIGQPGGYLAFAARRERNRPALDLLQGVGFALQIDGRGDEKEFDPELVLALRAWLLFGGVGARTRRGLGAVHSRGGYGDLAACENEIRALQAAGASSPGRRISEIWVTGRTFPSARAGFEHLDQWYRTYRQDRNGARGRSYWDEPELIRKAFGPGARHPRHAPLPVPQGKHAEGWARAVLGLPIVFKFKEDEAPVTTLQGLNASRLASPLLLRPVKLAPSEYIGVAVRLSDPGDYEPPGGLALFRPGDTRAICTPRITREVTRVWSELFAHQKLFRRVV